MSLPDESIRGAIVALLARRVPPATACPSEVARALAPGDWRASMGQVRAVAAAMAGEGLLDIVQGGRPVPAGQPLRGPVRLRRRDGADGARTSQG